MHPGLISLLFAVASELAAPAGLPDDPRLAPVRPRLEALVQKTAEAGLPADLVVSKVREGLAKGVDPARIEVAAGLLADNLHSARRFAEARAGAAPSSELVRALAQAKMAGVELDSAEPLLRGGGRARGTGDERAAVRAVEVLTDLSRRGYPAPRSSLVVRDVLTRDPSAIERLPSALETLRAEQALSHAEAVDALSRGLAGSESLQGAYSRTLDEERRKGGAAKGNKGKNGQSEAGVGAGPGKSELAPGHMKPMRGKPNK